MSKTETETITPGLKSSLLGKILGNWHEKIFEEEAYEFC